MKRDLVVTFLLTYLVGLIFGVLYGYVVWEVRPWSI